MYLLYNTVTRKIYKISLLFLVFLCSSSTFCRQRHFDKNEVLYATWKKLERQKHWSPDFFAVGGFPETVSRRLAKTAYY